MQYNVIRNGDVLMADSFMDLKKYLDSIVTMSSLNAGHNGGGIHKLIVKNSKCSLPIDEIKHCLRNSVLDELKEIEIITGDERFRTINGMLYSQNARRLYFCPRGIEGILEIPDGTDTITEDSCGNCSLSKVIIPDSVKRIDRYTPFVNASLIQACMRSNNLQHCHECNTWRLKIKGKPDVIVPKSCSTKSYATLIANKINAMINKSSEDEALTPPELYQYSTDSTGLTAALEQCRKYPNGNLRRFITRNIRVIFANLIIAPLNDSGEEIMVSLIKDGVFTDVALKKILEEIEKTGERRNLTTLKAYVLDTIGKSTDTFQI